MQSQDVENTSGSTSVRLKKGLRKLLFVSLFILFLVVAYIGAAFMVFDFSKPAFPFNQDNRQDDRPVAFGPRPRERFCPPDWQGVYWKGTEWPFIVFRPVCHWWCDHHGYATFKNEK